MSRALVVIGLALLALHGVLMLRAIRFKTSAVRVRGSIVGFQEITDGRTNSSGQPKRTYYPRVRFLAPDGRQYDFSSQAGSSGPAYRYGEIVQVLYPVGEPSAAEIDSFTAMWAGPVAVGFLGAIAVTLGVGEWLQARRMRGKSVGTVVRLKG